LSVNIKMRYLFLTKYKLLFLMLTHGSCSEIGPTVEVVKIGDSYVGLQWSRDGDWAQVSNFTISLDGASCSDFSCESPTCFFNTQEYCQSLDPCTRYTFTITGGDVAADPVSVTTAPALRPSLTLDIKMNKVWIQWLGPSSLNNCSSIQAEVTTKLNGNLAGQQQVEVEPDQETTIQQGLDNCTTGVVTVDVVYLQDGLMTDVSGNATYQHYPGALAAAVVNIGPNS
ncbi:unnamed protein product, partial [Meganyctiphanes norvegica]